MKFLLVLVVVGVGLWMLTARWRAASKSREKNAAPPPGTPAPPPPTPPSGTPRQMVACKACGVHLPADEAVYADQAPYCGPAHLPSGRSR